MQKMQMKEKQDQKGSVNFSQVFVRFRGKKKMYAKKIKWGKYVKE